MTFPASYNHGVAPAPSFFDRREHLHDQVFLEVFGKLRAITEPDKHEVEAGDDEAAVVVFTASDHQVRGRIGDADGPPPLTAVVGLDLGPGPGEVVIRRLYDP